MITELGTKIRKVRELKNLTQDYMAEQLNMSQSMYSKYFHINSIRLHSISSQSLSSLLTFRKENL